MARLLLLGAMLCAVVSGPAAAAESASDRPWSLEVTPYVWTAGISGDVGFGAGTAPVAASFGDIWDTLDVAFMGAVGLRYDRVAVFADFDYVRNTGKGSLPGPFFTRAKVGTELFYGTTGVRYRFDLGPGLTLDPYVGARWWSTGFELELNGGILPQARRRTEHAWADPVFGALLDYQIDERWFVGALADVGGGVSEFTWQVYGRGGYRFSDAFALTVGYRFIGVDYRRDGLVFDALLDGLLFGLSFRL